MLDEDGVTGWQTIYGLRRALQAELGVSPLGSAFGEMTQAAFVAQVGRITTTTGGRNLLMILSSALWCKGIQGLGPNYYDDDDLPANFVLMESSVAYLWQALGLGTSAAPYVDVKMMAWLLSMDTYRLLAGGTTAVQGVQRWLNGAYAARAGVAMVAADGVFTRPMQQALMIAVQLEIGFSEEEANGVFGPQTQGRLSGDPDYPYYRGPHFPHLFQSLLTVNGYPLVIDGDIGAGSLRAAGQFRYFMGLADTDSPAGSSVIGHYGTWAALLVSCGDPDRRVTGFDHRLQLPLAALQDAVSQGYHVVGRYTVGTTTDENGVTLDKFVDREEIQAMKTAGIDLLPIHQRMENSVSWMTYDYGYMRGAEATQRAHVLGLPENSIVYFAVDFDAYGATVDGPVRDFFRGINAAVNEVAPTYRMRVGVYGARNVCDRVVSSGLAVSSFVAGITYGWSGNMGFPMPSSWRYNQIKETTLTLGGAVRHVDMFDVARNAQPVRIAQVTGPPPELDGSATATGFSAFFDWLIGAVHVATRHVGSLTAEESFLVAPFAVMAWLQQREYSEWYWQLYIPETNWFDLLQLDLGLAIDLAQFQSLVDDLQEPLDGYGLPGIADREDELSHFAASFRGHLLWGASTVQTSWNPGDLGGWGLDLLQVWGEYAKQRGAGLSVPGSAADVDDLYEFALSYIGLPSGESAFSIDDLRADVDAYLLVRRMRGDTSAGLIEDLRALVSAGPTVRAQRFFDDRFGGSAARIGQVFLTLVEARPFEGFFAEQFMEALNGVSELEADSPMPDAAYCDALGRALAAHLSSD
ncbi:glycoside hydrolase domain-containing protein [Promicromonospora sukumoe]|uniref:glycoside hydrolase domain-containing protein n=1 Tax=Promicromonospora sukumoe TaxID=88382 RepID=UPI0037C868FA